jgi:hypothetical protein
MKVFHLIMMYLEYKVNHFRHPVLLDEYAKINGMGI